MTSFGVHLGPRNSDELKQFGKSCERIESLGFDSIWLADGLTRNIPDPLVVLALAAAHTTHVKLGTCVYIIPLRHPLVTAKLAASVDQLSGGRFILGIGVGWREDEFKATGKPFSKRGRISNECLEILLQAWTKGNVNFQGEFFNITDTKIDFGPVQKPHPPIWVGGNGKEAARRAARFADVWIPTDYSIEEYETGTSMLSEECKKINRDRNTIKIASHLLVIIDQSINGAEELAKKVAASLHENVDDLRKWTLVGDPKRIAQRLEEYNAAGVSYHVLNFATKVRDEERIELFAREVLPSFT